MKSLTFYINESKKVVFSKNQIQEIETLRNENNIFGDIPDNIAKIICKFYFRKLDENEKVTLFFDNDNKTIFLKNLEYISASTTRYEKLFKEGYKLVFNENSGIGIQSGMSKENSYKWPHTSGYT